MTSAAKAARVSHSGFFLSPTASDLNILTSLADKGQLKSIITVFEGIDKAKDAFALLESGRVSGKVVIKII